jgi:N-acetylglucosaminyldiphosphoundecaprenol N-acetyl-beta-D-mannosaminyltransferase
VKSKFVDSSGAVDLLGVEVTVERLEQAAARVVHQARSRSGGYGVLCNVHVLMTARRDPSLRKALAGANFVFADGAPIAWLQRRLGAQSARRVAGPDLMVEVVTRASGVGLRHALVGSTETTLRRLCDRLRSEAPDVNIVAAVAPPFGDSDDWSLEVVEQIRATRADVVWVALGAPKQEIWMREHASLLAPAVLLGVGAAFDFLAGTRPRAPLWMRKFGFEWVHRLCTEPGRLVGRYATTNSAFLLSVAALGARRLGLAVRVRRSHATPAE